MRSVSFLPAAFRDYVEWAMVNVEIFQKINELIKEIQRDPFKGKGKPEPLKGHLKRLLEPQNKLRTQIGVRCFQ